jgi:hypothetical protein
MKKTIRVICSPFRGKCKLYNFPKNECPHAKPHEVAYEVAYECTTERDCICGGICRKVKVQNK